MACWSRPVCLMLLAIVGGGVLAAPARAVILYEKPERNLTAPDQALANSGWQWEGQWSGFLGTAIAKSFFVTAEHIGGNVGDYFSYGGRRYKAVATFDDPNSDLQIWRVQGRFTSWAPLLTDYTDVRVPAMIIGRGTQRGADITLNGELKGWLWGTDDGAQSWGMNAIIGSTLGQTDSEAGHKKVKGGRLYWAFDRNGVANESALSQGDSGGGVFVQSNNKWRLAGVNYSTQANFSYPNSTDILQGALFDSGGLKSGDGIITDTAADIPALSYATRISTRSTWILDVLSGKIVPNDSVSTIGHGVPEPAWLPVCFAACLLGLRTSCRKLRSIV